jgi:hypothetical protein
MAASSLFGISNILTQSPNVSEDSQNIEDAATRIMAQHGVIYNTNASTNQNSQPSSYLEPSHPSPPLDINLNFGSDDGKSDNGKSDNIMNTFDTASEAGSDEMMETANEQSEIVQYLNILRESNVDVTYYKNKFSDNMSPRDARLLKYQLRATVERAQYTTMFEHVIVGTSLLIEKIFNGKRDFLGSKPNMVGWSGSVEQQLRQIRSTTNELVSKTLEKHSISAEKRILVTLAMSALMYQRRPIFATTETPTATDRYSSAVDNADRVLRQQ